jgi:hypothetical protein
MTIKLKKEKKIVILKRIHERINPTRRVDTQMWNREDSNFINTENHQVSKKTEGNKQRMVKTITIKSLK